MSIGGDTAEYVEVVIEEMLPRGCCGLAEFCDVFCEARVFPVEDARRVLEAARAAWVGIADACGSVRDRRRRSAGGGVARGYGGSSGLY